MVCWSWNRLVRNCFHFLEEGRKAGKRKTNIRNAEASGVYALFAFCARQKTLNARVLSLAGLFALFRDRRFKVALCFSVSAPFAIRSGAHLAEDVQRCLHAIRTGTDIAVL